MIYTQTRTVNWLKDQNGNIIPEGTLWSNTGIDNYIQPLDTKLVTTAFGVDLDLLDASPDEDLFK